MKIRNLCLPLTSLLVVILASTAQADQIVIPTEGQVVRIVQNKPNIANPLQLAEVEVFQLGSLLNLAPAGGVSQSTTLGGFVAGLGNDLNFNNFQHTLDQVGGGQTWQVDLGSLQELDSVHIWSRVGCCSQGRTADIQLQIFSDAAATNLVYDEQILGIGTSDDRLITLPISTVPEPSSWAMGLMGLLCLGLAATRRRKTNMRA